MAGLQKLFLIFIMISILMSFTIYIRLIPTYRGSAANQPDPTVETCLIKNQSKNFLYYPQGHKCLQIFAESKYCKDNLVVPKLVHYIFLGKTKFTFFFLLSVLSSYRILKPGFIYIHVDQIPEGKWWDHLLDLVPNIVIIKTQRVTQIFNIPIRVVQHQSDVMRIQILLEYGGIYMDSDEIALKSFDPLRKYPMTLGLCRLNALGVQVMISSPQSDFLKIWLMTYKTFDDNMWAKNSQYMPYNLSKIVPELIHIEELFSFAGFSGIVSHIFTRRSDWSKKYGLHLYIRLQKRQKSDPQHIKKLRSTYGEIARYIYYGKKDIIA